MIGSGELIVILLVFLLLFGGKKLPELARSLGIGIREFKKACNGEVDSEEPDASAATQPKMQPIPIRHEDQEEKRRDL